MRNPLASLIPIQLAFSIGKMRVLAVSMFDYEVDGDQEVVVRNTSTAFGFTLEPVEELDDRCLQRGPGRP